MPGLFDVSHTSIITLFDLTRSVFSWLMCPYEEWTLRSSNTRALIAVASGKVLVPRKKQEGMSAYGPREY